MKGHHSNATPPHTHGRGRGSRDLHREGGGAHITWERGSHDWSTWGRGIHELGEGVT